MNHQIINKLKIEEYTDRLLLNKPEYISGFGDITFDTSIVKPSYDLIFSFIFALVEFPSTINMVVEKELLNPNGYLYFAYPKKGNKRYNEYIGRDDFFTAVCMDKEGFINGSRLKFNKMVAFDEVFTCIGIKYESKTKNKSQPSQCVGDYIDRIPDLLQHFSENTEILNFFNKLTPGYQRDWARYVFSVKTEETKAKRLTEMGKILAEGYKSIDQYRQK